MMARRIAGDITMRIYKQFQIEAAHFLPYLPTDHKCRRLHGHSFKISVHIEGALDPRLGWVMDYADVSKAFQTVFEKIDHQYLNEIAGLENPTSENLAKWIWRQLQDVLPNLVAVQVNETCTSGCIYEGDE